MATTIIPKTLESTVTFYANLAAQKKDISAKMEVIKGFLVSGIGVGNEIVGDNYILSIAPGAISRIWNSPKDKDALEKALIDKGLLKLQTGHPYPVIKFTGDII